MEPTDWATITVAVATVLASFAGMVRWMVSHYLHELIPNSGSSMKDKINNLEKRVDEIYILLCERK